MALTAGQLIGTMAATNSPTSWAITAGNAGNYFAIDSGGNITLTSAGAAYFPGLTGTSTLTCQATNSAGSGSAAATINYSPGAVPSVASATIPVVS